MMRLYGEEVGKTDEELAIYYEGVEKDRGKSSPCKSCMRSLVENTVVYNFKQPLHQTELRPARL